MELCIFVYSDTKTSHSCFSILQVLNSHISKETHVCSSAPSVRKYSENSWKQICTDQLTLPCLIAEIVNIQNWSQTCYERILISEAQTDVQQEAWTDLTNQQRPAAESVIVWIWPQRMLLIGWGWCPNAAKWLSRFHVLYSGGMFLSAWPPVTLTNEQSWKAPLPLVPKYVFVLLGEAVWC